MYGPLNYVPDSVVGMGIQRYKIAPLHQLRLRGVKEWIVAEPPGACSARGVRVGCQELVVARPKVHLEGKGEGGGRSWKNRGKPYGRWPGVPVWDRTRKINERRSRLEPDSSGKPCFHLGYSDQALDRAVEMAWGDGSFALKEGEIAGDGNR